MSLSARSEYVSVLLFSTHHWRTLSALAIQLSTPGELQLGMWVRPPQLSNPEKLLARTPLKILLLGIK